jgi:hypothetical protein
MDGMTKIKLDNAMWFHNEGMFNAAIATMTGRYPVEDDSSVSKATNLKLRGAQELGEFYASLCPIQ